ncbi:MAG: Hsp20/alpha crystallin family protein [Prevotella sp.]|nr:Hsp20/alpha crystallin family protein [Prevotella sp.]
MLPTMYSNRNQGWIPSIFNDFFNDTWMPAKFTGTTPAINVSEDEKAYKVEVAAPGMTKEDFKISVANDDLVISMEKKTDNKEEDEKKKYLRREFSYSKFEQRLTLPDNIERQNICANMNDGVLAIVIPKKTEEEKAQETQCIEIK